MYEYRIPVIFLKYLPRTCIDMYTNIHLPNYLPKAYPPYMGRLVTCSQNSTFPSSFSDPEQPLDTRDLVGLSYNS